MNRINALRLKATVLLCLAGTIGAISAEGAKPKTEIVIAAASSLTDAMNEAIARYQVIKPDVTVTPTYGSSGSLLQQIVQGAPVDIFFSASPVQMDDLEAKKLLQKGTRRDMLANTLVLVTPKAATSVTGFTDAGTGKVKQIALGEPASVPAGQYAAAVFTSLGILDAVKAKTVYAKNVRQVLAYVEAGEVDAGVVYATDAALSKNVRVAATAPAGSHPAIVYPAAVIAGSAKSSEAKAFLAWLSETEADAIFARYGFTVK